MQHTSIVVHAAWARWRLARRLDEISQAPPDVIRKRYNNSTDVELDVWFPAWVRHELARGVR